MGAHHKDGLVPRVLAQGSALAPGTCGELAQGVLDGVTAMITCPIDLYSTATVELREGTGRAQGPAESPKAVRAVELTIALLGRDDLDGQLYIRCDVPRSKGMASSTADIVAAIGATAEALNSEISIKDQAKLALTVEPSDGVMLPGIALFDHMGGQIARSLGDPPDMRVLVLEFAGALDTETFNAVERHAELQRLESSFREALELITEGLERGDSELIGRGATLSALSYQVVLPKPQLPEAATLARDAGALGVNVAHSGTAIGLLFRGDTECIAWASDSARRRLSDLVAVHDRQLIGGGVVRNPL